jgi:hypothetical protein
MPISLSHPRPEVFLSATATGRGTYVRSHGNIYVCVRSLIARSNRRPQVSTD